MAAFSRLSVEWADKRFCFILFLSSRWFNKLVPRKNSYKNHSGEVGCILRMLTVWLALLWCKPDLLWCKPDPTLTFLPNWLCQLVTTQLCRTLVLFKNEYTLTQRKGRATTSSISWSCDTVTWQRTARHVIKLCGGGGGPGYGGFPNNDDDDTYMTPWGRPCLARGVSHDKCGFLADMYLDICRKPLIMCVEKQLIEQHLTSILQKGKGHNTLRVLLSALMLDVRVAFLCLQAQTMTQRPNGS